MKKNYPAYLQLASAQIIAGSSIVAGKIVTVCLPVFLSSAVSLFIAIVFMLPVVWRCRKQFASIRIESMVFLFLQALTGMVIFRICVLYGLKLTDAAIGGIITSTTPVVLGLVSFLILKEKLNAKKMIAVCAVFIGIVLANSTEGMTGTQNFLSFLGCLLFFMAVTGESLFSVLQKMIRQEIPSLLSTFIIICFGFLCFLPLSLFELPQFHAAGIKPQYILILVYYGAIVTTAAYFLWLNGLKKVPANIAAPFTGFMPVSAVVLSGLVLGEDITARHIASLCLVLFGVLISAKGESARTNSSGHN